MKIIITENQLRNLILIEGEPVTEKGTALEITLPPNTFGGGKYIQINGDAVQNAINQINSYISKYPKNTTINATIESSESKVPNYDREKFPSTGNPKEDFKPEKKLNSGELSRLRAENMRNYLTKILPQNVKLTIDDKGAQGPDWDKTLGANNKDYLKWQYVKLYVSVLGERGDENPVGESPICDFSETMKGGVAYPSNNFVGYSKKIDISKMKDGSKFKIVVSPYEVPDMLVVKSGEQIINTGFVGSPDTYWQIMLGTILHHTYIKNGQAIPTMFPQKLTRVVNYSSSALLKDDSGLVENLGHVIKIDWSNSPKKNLERVDGAGGWWTVEPGAINSQIRDDLFPGRYVGVAQFTKQSNMTSVDIYVYSPIGTTVWDIKGMCN